MPSNNFSDLKSNNALTKIFFIRMNPGKDITDSLDLISANLYKCTLKLKVNKVQLNGIDLAKVSNPTADKQYSFNEETGELKIFSVNAPSDSFVFIAYHYLFFTNDKFRYTYETPTDSTKVTREWQPRILGEVGFSQTVENIIQGTLSIASSSLKFKNNDSYFQNFLGTNDSFYNKKIELWIALDEVRNVKKVFEGVVTQIALDHDSVDLQVEDLLSKLQQPATFNTPSEYQYYNDNASIGFTIPPNKKGTVIPFLIGKFSKYALINANNAGRPNARKLDIDSLLEATCISYNATISGTNNRIWGLCLSYDSIPLIFPTLRTMTVDNSNANYTKISNISGTSDFGFIFVGDQITFIKGASFKYLDIIEVDYVNEYVYLEKDAGLDNTWFYSTQYFNASLFIQQGTTSTRLKQDRDFTIYNASVEGIGTAGSKCFIYVLLGNNIETTLGISNIDPVNDRIYFRIRLSNWGHGEILKRALNSAGIATNDASFAQADIDLPVHCNFTVPYVDETDIRPYFGYIEDILKSTLGYLRINSNFEVEYKLFSPPTSPAKITDSNIEKGSLSVEVKYKDIATEIIAYNAHLDAEDIISRNPLVTPSKTLKNNRSVFLNDVVNVDRFRHVVDNIVPTLQKILAIRSKRRVNYVMSTHGVNLDSQLGDEFKVVNDHALSSPSNEGVIVSIDGDRIIISEIPQ